MHLTFSTEIQASDVESRMLAGQIVPFGKPGSTSAGKVVFEKGSINIPDKGVKLLLEHDSKSPVGKSIFFKETEEGIFAKFSISKTQKGTDLLVEASDGLRTGFSVGCMIDDFEYDDDTLVVKSSSLIEVSAVSNAAFGADAQIAEVAASEPDAAESLEESESEVEKETTDEVVEVAVEEPVVQASAPAPIYTKARIKPLTQGEVLAHSVYAAAGNHDSRRILVEAADDTSNNTGFTLAKGLPTFITDSFSADNRPTVSAVGINALPASGLSFTLPRLVERPVVDEIAELDPVTQVDLESDYITIDVKKIAGKQTISVELLDRSEPSFGEIMLNELRRAYAKKSDEYLIAELANGTWSGGFSGDWQGLQAFIANQVPVAYKNTGGLIASELVASADWWAELIGAVDSSDRPVFNAVAPSNASGNVGVSAPRGTVFGTNLWVDHNISTAGLIDASAYLIAPSAVWYAESPQVQLRTNVLSDASVEVELYGYVAAKVLKPQGVRKFNLS